MFGLELLHFWNSMYIKTNNLPRVRINIRSILWNKEEICDLEISANSFTGIFWNNFTRALQSLTNSMWHRKDLRGFLLFFPYFAIRLLQIFWTERARISVALYFIAGVNMLCICVQFFHCCSELLYALFFINPSKVNHFLVRNYYIFQYFCRNEII